MLTIKARYFIDLGAEFSDLRIAYYAASLDGGSPITIEEVTAAENHFETVWTLCQELKLSTSYALLTERISRKTLPKTLESFEMLRDAVFAELKDKWFAYIPAERLDYFETAQIVSYEVRQAFPRATSEIMNAGTCYAVGLATASVFHAMRAAEIGLQTMALKLDVTLSHPIELAGFGTLIGEIEDKIKEFRIGQRTAEKDRDSQFYSEAAAQFRHFNNGWRIRSAHSRETYEDDQAKKVLGPVLN